MQNNSCTKRPAREATYLLSQNLFHGYQICFRDTESVPPLSKAIKRTIKTKLRHLHSAWKARISGPPSHPVIILPWRALPFAQITRQQTKLRQLTEWGKRGTTTSHCFPPVFLVVADPEKQHLRPFLWVCVKRRSWYRLTLVVFSIRKMETHENGYLQWHKWDLSSYIVLYSFGFCTIKYFMC